MTRSLLDRLRGRARTIRKFASAAHGPRDLPALILAGIARDGVFQGKDLRARAGRLLGSVVTPRLGATHGGRVRLDLRDFTDLMIFEEVFLSSVYPVDEIPFAPVNIIDCGACLGHFTLLAASRHPTASFELFEPHPANLEKLRLNLELNAIDGKVHPSAVGPVASNAVFVGEGFGGHLANNSAAGFPVSVISLPDFLSALPSAPLWLKIDIEGTEETLIPRIAELLPPRTAIFLETHHNEATCAAYLAPLFSSGFTEHVIRRRSAPESDIEYVERLFVRA